MSNGVVVAASIEVFVTTIGEIHKTIAGGATSVGAVGTTILVQQEVPEDNCLAMEIHGADANLPHMPHKIVAKVGAPSTDTLLGKIDTLVGRFHTELKNSDEKNPNLLQSAVS
jgi:hypothetical protein